MSLCPFRPCDVAEDHVHIVEITFSGQPVATAKPIGPPLYTQSGMGAVQLSLPEPPVFVQEAVAETSAPSCDMCGKTMYKKMGKWKCDCGFCLD